MTPVTPFPTPAHLRTVLPIDPIGHALSGLDRALCDVIDAINGAHSRYELSRLFHELSPLVETAMKLPGMALDRAELLQDQKRN